MLLEHQIGILECFVKYHVTLKTGVMAAEKFSFPSKEYIMF